MVFFIGWEIVSRQGGRVALVHIGRASNIKKRRFVVLNSSAGACQWGYIGRSHGTGILNRRGGGLKKARRV